MGNTLWNIVLAAGAGKRLSSVTGGIPKQFWSADGGSTLLEDTLDRSAKLTPTDRTVVIVDRSHTRYIAALPQIARDCRVVYQPSDRGTAVGVLLGLIEVVSADPDAVVLLLPSDHGIRNLRAFVTGVRRATLEVRSSRSHVVLFGVAPSSADDEYGWITPHDGAVARLFRAVATFVEKPAPVVARQLFEAGAVWNTMVLVGRATALLSLYRRHLPELADAFVPALGLLPVERTNYFASLYDQLPVADFSHDVLSRADGLTLYSWPATLGWSDLGTPDRLNRWDMTHHTLHQAS